jgi:predicted transcriptional regulator of viral defense system
MPLTIDLDPRIRRAFGEHAVVRAADLFDRGVHPRTVYGLRDAGQLEQVSRGVYRLVTAPVPPHLDLLAVAARAPHGVVCLVSALAFHELTDEIPHEVSIAILRGATAPIIDHPPVRIFRFADFAHRLGIEHHKIEGIDLKVYSAAKSIVDAFRFRNRIGEDIAIKALASGLRSRRVRPGALLDLAGKVRVRSVIEPYLKALT